MLVELSVMEQRYQAVLAVVQDGRGFFGRLSASCAKSGETSKDAYPSTPSLRS